MDHSEAANGHAVERYLLGEMGEPEADAFELHFFECTVCTEELASGALLVENLRAVAVPEPAWQPPKLRPRTAFVWWKRPLFAAPAFAAVALAFTVAYQARELARLNQPQALLSYNLKSASRGEPDRIRIVGAANSAINLDLPDAAFPAYQCDFQDSSGRLRYSVVSPAPTAGSPLSILVTGHSLAPGAYTLSVRGLRGSLAGPEAARYFFEAVTQ